MSVTLHKTLVLRLSSIGDVILATPFIRALKAAFPTASIDVAVKSEFSDLLAHNPHIDRLITLDTSTGRAALRALRDDLRVSGYDAVFDLHGNFRTRMLRRGVAAVTRVIRKRSMQRLLLVCFKLNLLRNAPSVSERYHHTGVDFGIRSDGGAPEVFVPEDVERAVYGTLRDLGISDDAVVIGLAPGARHFTKRWPAEYWAELAMLLSRKAGVRMLLLGGEADRECATAISRAASGAAVNVCGAFSLLESAAALGRCAAVCANDSGLMHLATARGVPVVALFGSTVREFGFFPMGARSTVLEVERLACRPCTHLGRDRCPEGHFRCLRDVLPERVARAVETAAGNSERRSR